MKYKMCIGRHKTHIHCEVVKFWIWNQICETNVVQTMRTKSGRVYQAKELLSDANFWKKHFDSQILACTKWLENGNWPWMASSWLVRWTLNTGITLWPLLNCRHMVQLKDLFYSAHKILHGFCHCGTRREENRHKNRKEWLKCLENHKNDIHFMVQSDN